MKGIVVGRIPDPAWGSPRIGRLVPADDHPWGRYRFLVGTAWEGLFPVVSPDVLDAALRGHATPLMRLLGPPPAVAARRLPVESAQCRQKNSCTLAAPHCIPGPRVPDCWESSEFPLEYMNPLVRLWREGVPVVVVCAAVCSAL